MDTTPILRTLGTGSLALVVDAAERSATYSTTVDHFRFVSPGLDAASTAKYRMRYRKVVVERCVRGHDAITIFDSGSNTSPTRLMRDDDGI
jgi:hypothetical protein